MDGNSIITQVAQKNAVVDNNDVEVAISVELSAKLKKLNTQDYNENIPASIFIPKLSRVLF